MNRFLTIAATTILVASSAVAATPAATCSKSTPDKFKPQAELIALLKTKGLTVSKIKVENGCYETYAKDATGKKVNSAYNAETLEILDNAEAGETVKPKQ